MRDGTPSVRQRQPGVDPRACVAMLGSVSVYVTFGPGSAGDDTSRCGRPCAQRIQRSQRRAREKRPLSAQIEGVSGPLCLVIGCAWPRADALATRVTWAHGRCLDRRGHGGPVSGFAARSVKCPARGVRGRGSGPASRPTLVPELTAVDRRHRGVAGRAVLARGVADGSAHRLAPAGRVISRWRKRSHPAPRLRPGAATGSGEVGASARRRTSPHLTECLGRGSLRSWAALAR